MQEQTVSYLKILHTQSNNFYIQQMNVGQTFTPPLASSPSTPEKNICQVKIQGNKTQPKLQHPQFEFGCWHSS